ncbi:acyl-CoA thioesterase [Oceanobacillus salinisoli]|uniref:acyl-CoA thioesterase n=1 Tax=Oceanobacillus salinisoli TaxID=2678611 RepID=UPI002F3552A5
MQDYINDFERWKAEFEFSIPIKIRFSETDMYGHVNNVSAFIYFEEARIDFLYTIGLHELIQKDGGAVIVADQQCDYHRQMFFYQRIKLFVKVNHIGTTSFNLHYLALNERKQVTLTGRGRMVYVNATSSKPKPLTLQMKELLSAKEKPKTDSLK